MSKKIIPIHQKYVLENLKETLIEFKVENLLNGGDCVLKNKIFENFKLHLNKIIISSSYKKLLSTEKKLYSYLYQMIKLNDDSYQRNLNYLFLYLEINNLDTIRIRAYIRRMNNKDQLIKLKKIINYDIDNTINIEKKVVKENVEILIEKLFEPIYLFEKAFLSLYNKFGKNNYRNLHIERTGVKILIKEKEGRHLSEPKIIKNINEITETDFNYWCSYMYVLAQDIEICPYCASQYIYTYNVSRNENDIPNGTVRPELDHFIPQKKHPFLSMSIFNLIPSCHTCNSSIKGQTEYNHKYYLNLFTEEIESKFRFRIECNEDENEQMKVLLGNSDKFIITYDNLGETDEEKEKINYFLDFFHIEARYQYFKGFIQEFVFFRTNHSKSYINFLVSKFDIRLEKDEYFIHAQFNKRLMGKLVDDINFQLEGDGFYFPTP